MIKKFLMVLVIVAVLASFAACAGGTNGPKTGIQEGNAAPNFSLYDLEGNNVKLSDFQGKVIILNFWATWCGPCEAEMSSMEAMYQNYKDKGLIILAINVGDSKIKVKRYVKEHNLTFPVLLDWSQAIAGNFATRGFPTTFIIDKNGIISVVAIGMRDWGEEQNSKLVTDLLSK